MRKGIVSVSVIAGPIQPTHQPIHDDIGKGINMGDYFHFHITPKIAKQWISVLETIATNETSN